MPTKQFIRSVLLLFAFSGIFLSVFWDILISGSDGSTGGDSSVNDRCPFVKTTPLAKALNNLPDLEATTTHSSLKTLDSLCVECIVLNGKVYRAGSINSLFPNREMNTNELAILLGGQGEASDHSKDAALQLVEKKLELVGKLHVS